MGNEACKEFWAVLRINRCPDLSVKDITRAYGRTRGSRCRCMSVKPGNQAKIGQSCKLMEELTCWR